MTGVADEAEKVTLNDGRATLVGAMVVIPERRGCGNIADEFETDAAETAGVARTGPAGKVKAEVTIEVLTGLAAGTTVVEGESRKCENAGNARSVGEVVSERPKS